MRGDRFPGDAAGDLERRIGPADNISMNPTPAPAPLRDAPGERAWDEALALRRSGRPTEALAALERWLTEDPGARDHAETRRLRALLHADSASEAERHGDPAAALRALERALEDAPDFPDLHHRLGVVRLRVGDAKRARVAFQEAIRRAPGFAAPRLELALLDARQGKLGESLELLRRLGEQTRPVAEDEFRRGMARLAEADWEGGEDVLRKALGLDQAPVDARLREVGTLLAAGRTAEAVARARALVEAYPGFPDAHLALALVRREFAEWDDCAESCGAALELNPAYHQARVYLAEALSRRGQWAEADHQLASVFADQPDHPLAHALAKSLRRASLPGFARPASP